MYEKQGYSLRKQKVFFVDCLIEKGQLKFLKVRKVEDVIRFVKIINFQIRSFIKLDK